MDKEQTTSTVVRQPQQGCAPNVAYVRSLLGIFKLLQVLMSIITFALSVSYPWGSQGGGWVNFVSINAFINSIIWFVLHLFNFIPAIVANFFIELILYAVWTIFFFIAGLVAACRAPYLDGVIGATAFFCFLCMILFGVDAFMQFLEVRRRYKARNDRRPPSESGNAAAEDTLFVRPNDKGFY